MSYKDLQSSLVITKGGNIKNIREEAKGILEIYPNDSINKCNSYSYRIWKDKISITEYDMVMELKIEKISTDKMVLKSRYIPREIAWTEEVMKAKQEGYNLYFSKK